jgi:hypothetical protein
MASRSVVLASLTALAALAAGCPKPPPPVAPPEPIVQVAAPPPKKCEAFNEKCVGTVDTRARITNSTLVFSPAAGWVYAQQSSSTVAQTSDSGPALAFLGIDIDPKDAKKEIAAKDAALAELCKQIGLAPLKRKVPWKKPDDKKIVGALKLDVWQLDESGVRGAQKGPLLVVTGPTPDGKGVVGLGFVPDDDKSSADVAIMKSIESLGTGK